MSKPVLLSDLSPARQALIRLCQEINFGSVEELEICDGEPEFASCPVVWRDLKLDSDELPRQEVALTDFVVSNEIVRLMRHLDGVAAGTVRLLEVRAGIPRRISLATRLPVAGSTE